MFTENVRETIETVNDRSTINKLKCILDDLNTQYEKLKADIILPETRAKKSKELPVETFLDINEVILRNIFQTNINKDLVIRRFRLSDGQTEVIAAAVEGLSDKKLIDTVVIRPLISTEKELLSVNPTEFERLVSNVIPGNQVTIVSEFSKISAGLLNGDTAIFINGMNAAILVDTRGGESRGPERPQIEATIRGSQVAFTEGIRTNTGLIRSNMRSNDLVTEMVEIGEQSITLCAIMYLQSVANKQLIAEVKKRVQSIKVDHVAGSGALELSICDHPLIPLPQALSTERPDRVVSHLAEGRVAIIVDGDPFVLIVPFQFFGFFHTSEDFNIQTFLASFSRIFRLGGVFLACTLPGTYLAISYFHPEALPTDLVLAIAGARERVPFPAIIEVLLMELSFELIREAGARIPGVLGSTIGIVGAIIIGQAAVTANLVSPISVVIVAVTGLASFTIPDYRVSLAIRIARYLYILIGYSIGLVGIAIGILSSLGVLTFMKSFGVPYTAPVAPKTTPGFDTVFRGPVYLQERRPDELNTQVKYRQPEVSRGWIRKQNNGEGDS
ncbi:spore germination protein [Sporomusa sphaeroides DSM 2875]|uniref:spore germination protein n=1 Tax=Sporomusa sphaeroides TaxID=47679 RepID=UPI00202FE7C7|nr:spore germination protein [Sporomusa sphaeroides]MCM0759792.1 spore germination protein [Sporomusa sphaeroides DSM 2875]